MPAAALAAWVIFRFTVLPDPWSEIVTGLFIVVLLTWAGSLMLRATTADDVEAELPGRETGSETTTGYGIHVSRSTMKVRQRCTSILRHAATNRPFPQTSDAESIR